MRTRLALLSLCALALAGCQTAGGLHAPAPPSPAPAPGAPPPSATAPGNRAPVSPWEDARERGMAFRAAGNEPAWSVEVQKSRSPTLFVVLDYGQRHLEIPHASVSSNQETGLVTFRGNAGNGTPVELVVHRGQCQDDMSGQKFAASAALTVGTDQYTGCGQFLLQ